MSRRGKKDVDNDEVEEILQAAEAMMLLSLTTDTHLARGAALSADLDRRLNTLKAPPPGKVLRAPKPAAGATKMLDAGSKAIADEEMKKILGDDLSARFAALKATTSSPSVGNSNLIEVDLSRAESGGSSSGDEDEDGVSTKAVEKLLQWAKDAARLDPSPPSDDEAADEVDVKEYSTPSGDESEKRKKKKKMEKKKMRLWIY